MKTFFQLRESLQEAKDKHNFTSAQHKAAADYHHKMMGAHESAGHEHRMDEDEPVNHHTKAYDAHYDAHSFHRNAAAHKAGDKDHGPANVQHAHKASKKANRISANPKGTDVKVSDHYNGGKKYDMTSYFPARGKPKSHPYGEKIPG